LVQEEKYQEKPVKREGINNSSNNNNNNNNTIIVFIHYATLALYLTTYFRYEMPVFT
jgi:hypothetical protein